MMTRALILAGCFEDVAWHNAHKTPAFDGAPDLIAFHRSLPHSHLPSRVWPDLADLSIRMLDTGYQVQPILMIRDWHATQASQNAREWFDEDAAENIRRAIRDVATALPNFIPVTYEAFCFSEQFRNKLFLEYLKLPKTPIDIWYANAKHYDTPTEVKL
jgi:hypothetical protein